MSGFAIEVKKLHVARQGTEVLSNLNFHVYPGEVFALLGGNGAGKSTTLLTCIGMLKPSHGDVIICGKSASGQAEEVRRSLAYLSENASLYEHLSARENLRYFLELAAMQVSRRQVALASPLSQSSRPLSPSASLGMSRIHQRPSGEGQDGTHKLEGHLCRPCSKQHGLVDPG